ncbi:hypothetical protein [Gluconacetobacter sacchari]|uniref:Uncharacterized protein n=1 Tax=Gluconacetobacter sacchari TaxID=92759 RepID=A0A7W4NQ85_9PROT|nr:hypothetical protein [Gluconacetobacter sacchari]MBB2159703.1 hypothetical protein [Gluconacetobacter sacchari]
MTARDTSDWDEIIDQRRIEVEAFQARRVGENAEGEQSMIVTPILGLEHGLSTLEIHRASLGRQNTKAPRSPCARRNHSWVIPLAVLSCLGWAVIRRDVFRVRRIAQKAEEGAA